jgi:Ca2+:H+ antiporter
MLRGIFGLGQELLATRWSLLLLLTVGALFLEPSEGMSTGPLVGIFVVCGLGLIPLARMLSEIVDVLVIRLGSRLGGLVSVCLGNLVEMVVSFTALASGLYSLVVISIIGAVITNCLVVLGISTIVAGRGRPNFSIHPYATGLQSQQLVIAAIFFAIPTVFYHSHSKIAANLEGAGVFDKFALYSVIVSVIVLIYYFMSYVYQSRTAQSLYLDQEKAEVIGVENEMENSGKKFPLSSVLIVLLLVSLVLVGVSDHLVASLEHMVNGTNISPLFVGLFLLPVFGAFAEGLIGVKAALSDQMDLALAISVESSAQLLLFVLPVLVLVGVPMGRFLHLSVPVSALFAVGATVMAVRWTTENHKLSWYEGLLLLTLYFVMALGVLLLS